MTDDDAPSKHAFRMVCPRCGPNPRVDEEWQQCLTCGSQIRAEYEPPPPPANPEVL